MSNFKLTNLVLIIVTGLSISTLAAAQDEPENNGSVDESIANNFSYFLGSNSGELVTAFRNGDNINFGEPNNVTTVDNPVGQMGFGEISIALGLAETLVRDDVTPENIANVLQNTDGTGIMDMRADDMGWGQIFNAHGTTVGAVISRLNANEAAQARLAIAQNSAANRTDNLNQRPQDVSADRPDRPNQGEFPDRPDTVGRPERPDLPSRPGRP